MKKPVLISIVGPTAVGKTALAVDLAERLETEIISADSRQFYRELTIGTAKPGSDELARVRHHFIDSHSISEDFSAGAYGRRALEKISSLHQKHEVLVAVGGSTLYLKALWEGFDDMPVIDPSIREKLNGELKVDGLSSLLKELEEKDPAYYHLVDRNNGQRVIRALEVIRGSGKPFSAFRKNERIELPYINLKIGLDLDREVLFDRIEQRMDIMLEQGLEEEVRTLVAHRHQNALQTVGYKEVFEYLDGAYDRKEMVRLLKRNSRRYAKRQMTWFRRYQDIHWFRPNQVEEIYELIASTFFQK